MSMIPQLALVGTLGIALSACAGGATTTASEHNAVRPNNSRSVSSNEVATHEPMTSVNDTQAVASAPQPLTGDAAKVAAFFNNGGACVAVIDGTPSVDYGVRDANGQLQVAHQPFFRAGTLVRPPIGPLTDASKTADADLYAKQGVVAVQKVHAAGYGTWTMGYHLGKDGKIAQETINHYVGPVVACGSKEAMMARAKQLAGQ